MLAFYVECGWWTWPLCSVAVWTGLRIYLLISTIATLGWMGYGLWSTREIAQEAR